MTPKVIVKGSVPHRLYQVVGYAILAGAHLVDRHQLRELPDPQLRPGRRRRRGHPRPDDHHRLQRPGLDRPELLLRPRGLRHGVARRRQGLAVPADAAGVGRARAAGGLRDRHPGAAHHAACTWRWSRWRSRRCSRCWPSCPCWRTSPAAPTASPPTSSLWQKPDWFPLDTSDQGWQFLVLCAIATVMFVIASNMMKSRPGRSLVALRDSEVGAAVSGVWPAGWKTGAFALSAAYGAVGRLDAGVRHPHRRSRDRRLHHGHRPAHRRGARWPRHHLRRRDRRPRGGVRALLHVGVHGRPRRLLHPGQRRRRAASCSSRRATGRSWPTPCTASC